jgi:hypothetical protein
VINEYANTIINSDIMLNNDEIIFNRKIQLYKNDQEEWLKKFKTNFLDFEKKRKLYKRRNICEIIFSSNSESDVEKSQIKEKKKKFKQKVKIICSDDNDTPTKSTNVGDSSFGDHIITDDEVADHLAEDKNNKNVETNKILKK